MEDLNHNSCARYWRFVCEQNIASYKSRLQSESDPQRRELLKTLIVEEEAKLRLQSASRTN